VIHRSKISIQARTPRPHHVRKTIAMFTSTSFRFKRGSRRQQVGRIHASRQQVSKILHDERRELAFAQFVYPFARGLAA